MEPSFDNFLSDLNSDRWNARRSAARGLGELGDHQAVKPLLERLRVEDWVSVRSALVGALRLLCDARDVPRLAEALPALPEDAQEGVVALLGDLRDARAVPALLGLVRRAEEQKREADLQTQIDQMGVEENWRMDFRSLREENLQHRRDRWRHAAQVYSQVAAALRQIGREVIPALIVGLRDAVPAVVRLAAEVLADVGDARVLTELRAALRRWKRLRPDVKKAIQEAIVAIETRLSAFTGHELELVELAPEVTAPPSGRELMPAGNGRCTVPSEAEWTGRELEEAEGTAEQG